MRRPPQKQVSINFPKELDDAVYLLRSRREYLRCSYAECVRILLAEGAKAIETRRQNNDGKL